MPSIRQLPSGSWQATVYIKGKRYPFTHRLKKVVEKWAREQEAARDAGRWRDPRLAEITLTEWWDIWVSGRVVAQHTMRCDASTWRKWLQPKWGDHTLAELEMSRDKIKTWIRELVDDPEIGASTVINVGVMLGSMLGDAVDSGRIVTNPAQKLQLPQRPKKPPFFWRHDEAAALIAELSYPYDVLVDFDLHVGPRIEELTGLLVDCVDVGLRLVHIVRVNDHGVLRDYPKSLKSYRSVPIPEHLVDAFAALVDGRPDNVPVWPSSTGWLLDHRNWNQRVFEPALQRARVCQCASADVDSVVAAALKDWKCPVGRHHWKGAPPCACRPADMVAFTERALGEWRCGNPRHRVRRGTAHDMRHTAASWLAMAGVDRVRIQDLLGHEDPRTTDRYMHLDPSKHDAIKAVWGDGGLTAGRARFVRSDAQV